MNALFMLKVMNTLFMNTLLFPVLLPVSKRKTGLIEFRRRRKERMGVFYLDLEFTNGNFYVGDIFEIAVLSEHSGNMFHSYIYTPERISSYVLHMCGVEIERIRQAPTFCVIMTDLFNFIKEENDEKQVILIAHGGLGSDFPLLFVNCMRRQKTKDFIQHLDSFSFLDSVETLQNSYGYRKTSLDVLTGKRDVHSAVEDAELLKMVADDYRINKDLNISILYSAQDILHKLTMKLPISIKDLNSLSNILPTKESFERALYEFSTPKTALSKKQVPRIANMYFNKII